MIILEGIGSKIESKKRHKKDKVMENSLKSKIGEWLWGRVWVEVEEGIEQINVMEKNKNK